MWFISRKLTEAASEAQARGLPHSRGGGSATQRGVGCHTAGGATTGPEKGAATQPGPL